MPILIIVALVAFVLWSRSSSTSSGAPPSSGRDPRDAGIETWTLSDRAQDPSLYYPPPNGNAGSSSTPLKAGCQKVFAYNDPSRYVPTKDQRVQGVSYAMKGLSAINCGAIGLVEQGWTEVKKLWPF